MFPGRWLDWQGRWEVGPHLTVQAWQPRCQTCFPDPSQHEVPRDLPAEPQGYLELVLRVRARLCTAWELVARQVAGVRGLRGQRLLLL